MWTIHIKGEIKGFPKLLQLIKIERLQPCSSRVPRPYTVSFHSLFLTAIDGPQCMIFWHYKGVKAICI